MGKLFVGYLWLCSLALATPIDSMPKFPVPKKTTGLADHQSCVQQAKDNEAICLSQNPDSVEGQVGCEYNQAVESRKCDCAAFKRKALCPGSCETEYFYCGLNADIAFKIQRRSTPNLTPAQIDAIELGEEEANDQCAEALSECRRKRKRAEKRLQQAMPHASPRDGSEH